MILISSQSPEQAYAAAMQELSRWSNSGFVRIASLHNRLAGNGIGHDFGYQGKASADAGVTL